MAQSLTQLQHLLIFDSKVATSKKADLFNIELNFRMLFFCTLTYTYLTILIKCYFKFSLFSTIGSKFIGSELNFNQTATQNIHFQNLSSRSNLYKNY